MELDFTTFALLFINFFSLGLVGFLGLMMFAESRDATSHSPNTEQPDHGCLLYIILLIVGFNVLLWLVRLRWLIK